ncbi:hypothetical protein [Flavobacterium sp.]|jgi:hypothetical protein|uniref:hypothetical protein n=1 Tax=Flavobacterium sp. TaxID=239 RepID=UPI0037C03D9E
MKKILAILMTLGLSYSNLSIAGPHHHYPHHVYHGSRSHFDVMVPMVIGGLALYALTQPRVVPQSPVYQPQPVVIAPPPVIQAQNLPPVWYYCQSSQTYYPYSQTCHEGWKVVPAVPQN